MVAAQLCLQAFVIMLAYYLLKVIREPMILADGSAELKAYSTAAQAILLMLIVPVFARLYQQVGNRAGKHHLLRNTLAFFILNLVCFGIAYGSGWRIAIIFYIWLGIFSVMVLALFWAFATDLFNLKSGQRIFPLMAAAASLGALLGSGAAGWLDQQLGHGGVMYLSAALLCLPWWLSGMPEREVPTSSRAHTGDVVAQHPYSPLEGFNIVLRNHYLMLIAGFVIVLNLINTNGEYVLASFVTDAAGKLTQLPVGRESADDYITSFYSLYLFATTLLSFLVQLFLVSRIFERVGISGAMLVLPVLMIACYSMMALIPTLVVARGALMLENSVNYSLQTTTRHALFLPVSREEKYIGKHTIDTFLFRVGDVLSGSFVYLASAVVGLGMVGFIGINIVLAGLLLLLALAIGRRHNATARESLSNAPPVVAAPLNDISIPAGQLSHMEIDPQTFVDPDIGDALKYQAYAFHSERLPSWIRFDGLNRRFRFLPPAASIGTLTIRVVARDFDGLEAEVSFNVDYGR